MTATALSERAMLCSVNVARWQATRTDKQVSADVAAQHAVSTRRAGAYRKHAIDVDAPSYVGVVKAAGEIRRVHYWHTLPWGQDGSRILTAVNFQKYSDEIRDARAKFENAVAVFVADYPRLCANAVHELNGMYNAKDYPGNIAGKFAVDVSIMPLPDANDFRARLADADIAQIKLDIGDSLAHSVATAMREPYQRLFDHLSRMVERLGDPENTFKDTLVTGLTEICGILPALNLTDDPVLDELRQKAETLVHGIRPQDLRDDLTTREAVKGGAADILAQMAGFMGDVT